MVLLEDCDEADAVRVAKALRSRVEGHTILAGRPVRISVGVAGLQGEESCAQVRYQSLLKLVPIASGNIATVARIEPRRGIVRS